MTEKEIKLLKESIASLQKAANILKKSYENCKRIKTKKEYSYEELTEFEALASRFARLLDLLIQKVFRTIDRITFAPEGTVRDSMNRAEKNLLIEHVESLVDMKRLRNEVAHEYIMENLVNFFGKILEFTPLLLDCVNRTVQYCEELERKY